MNSVSYRPQLLALEIQTEQNVYHFLKIHIQWTNNDTEVSSYYMYCQNEGISRVLYFKKSAIDYAKANAYSKSMEKMMIIKLWLHDESHI